MDTAATLRSARLSRRAWSVTLVLLLVAASLFGGYRINQEFDLKPGPDEYNLGAWEIRHLPGKWLFLLGEFFRGAPPRESQDAHLRRFFDLTDGIETLERSLSEAEQRGEDVSRADRDRLQRLIAERDEIENQVEATLEGRLSDVASELGLTRSFLEIVWPPIDFEFTDSPRTLVTSPRDRIELRSTTLLREDLSLPQIETIESRVEAEENVSALAFSTSGIGAYPTIIDYEDDYRDALRIVAHEWMHNYLFFTPLGFNYYDNSDTRTINETVADLVANELAEAVIERWPLPQATEPPTPAPELDGDEIDVGEELRALRGEVEDLLAEGRVEEAEALMEQRRLELAEQGYRFRKLNQAYFAFTNLYAGEAGSPAATSPIGPKVDELRRRSSSLSDFVSRVSGITSVEELDRLLAEAP